MKTLVSIVLSFSFVITCAPLFAQDAAQDNNQPDGINLNFSVHDIYLAFFLLRSKSDQQQYATEQYKQDVTALQTYMAELSTGLYDQLMAIPIEDISPANIKGPRIKSLLPFLIQATNTPEFSKLLSQTYEYGKACRDQWNGNYEKTAAIIGDLTGFQFKKSFTVYITHPAIPNMRCLEDEGLILYGQQEAWNNQNTVRLWHEIMKTYMPQDTIGQAVIELLCDDHLRTQLNGETYPPLSTVDPALKEIKEKLLTDWQTYIQSGDKNILTFIVRQRQKGQ